MSIIGFLGSSRSDGHTAALTRQVFTKLDQAELVDLSKLTIGPYSYDDAYAADDFAPLAQKMKKAKAIVFASPVYWYSMSAQMKTFFDRLTDLTGGALKPIGKSLAGKHMFAIATGGSPSAPASFTQPFADTAGYFDMHWGGLLYARSSEVHSTDTEQQLKKFSEAVQTSI
ncbi:flavodoxin family protein [Hyphococcus flavus]|uniref:Flavodoxin family protein n=1 Tax=Hyphococcus flavus TaxID=1866326 RepID=A0AAE9ZCB8_9PROT|nr:flavodoxin family protein [Hyphococcus flavus]WDI32169.1 flavodoxin family protein [Hyphococcus flavus]